MVGPSLNTPKPPTTTTATIKFLCSYGGKILPRYPDGKLRYHGGQTRVLAIQRSIPFSELLVKLGELCGSPVGLRCQLPSEDLDALVSVKCDEDLVNLIEEYDRASSLQSSPLKIRAFLTLPKKSSSSPSPSPSSASGSGFGSGSSSSSSTTTHEAGSPKTPSSPPYPTGVPYRNHRCIHQTTKPPVKFPSTYNKSAGKLPYYGYGSSSRNYLVHNGNHWQ